MKTEEKKNLIKCNSPSYHFHAIITALLIEEFHFLNLTNEVLW